MEQTLTSYIGCLAFTERGWNDRSIYINKEGKARGHFKGKLKGACTGASSSDSHQNTLCSFQNESYWNVMVFCCDGTLALNRLSVGLIFPQLQDEISVICPVRLNYLNFSLPRILGPQCGRHINHG